jgi:hypothetical protein
VFSVRYELGFISQKMTFFIVKLQVKLLSKATLSNYTTRTDVKRTEVVFTGIHNPGIHSDRRENLKSYSRSLAAFLCDYTTNPLLFPHAYAYNPL